MRSCLILNTYGIVLQIIPEENTFLISTTGREKFAEKEQRGCQCFVTRITLLWSSEIFGGGRVNTVNRIWMKIANE
jgi:hypothetical protein